MSVFAAAALAVAAPPTGGVFPAEQAAYDAMVADQARSAEARFSGSRCGDARVEVVEVKPAALADNPDMLVWRTKVRVDGCGRSSVQNLNVGRFTGAPPWLMTSGLPGDSLAETGLQEGVYKAAVAEVRRGFVAGCDIRLADAYIAAKPGDLIVALPGVEPPPVSKGRPQVSLPDTLLPHVANLDLASAWVEVWPFQVCGKDRTLGVAFLPRKDGRGGVPMFMPIWSEIEAHGQSARPPRVTMD